MDLAFYNQGYKALSLLITILASVVMNRLLSRGPLGIGSVRVRVCVCVCVFVCVVFVCVCGSGVCVPNMLRNQKLPGQSRTFFFHRSKQLVIAYDLCLQCVGGQMISKHFLIRENEPSPASVSQPRRVVKCWEGVG